MRKQCSECGRRVVARRSRHKHGVISPRGDHDLCQRCWKAYRDRVRLLSGPSYEDDDTSGQRGEGGDSASA